MDTKKDDKQLVAVIMAAVAASLGTSTYNLRIKSIRRTGNAWSNAGPADIMDGRKLQY